MARRHPDIRVAWNVDATGEDREDDVGITPEFHVWLKFDDSGSVENVSYRNPIVARVMAHSVGEIVRSLTQYFADASRGENVDVSDRVRP